MPAYQKLVMKDLDTVNRILHHDISLPSRPSLLYFVQPT